MTHVRCFGSVRKFAIVTTIASGLATGLLLACTAVSSADLRSGGIEAHYSVTGESKTGNVGGYAYFTSGLNSVDLATGQDQIAFEGAAMGRSKGLLGNIQYTGTVAKKAVGATYTFELTRPNERYVATVAQPPPVSVTFPALNEHVVTNAPFVIRWKAENTGKMKITFSAQTYQSADGGSLCGAELSYDADDTGEHSFPAMRITPVGTQAEGGPTSDASSDAGADAASTTGHGTECPRVVSGILTIARRVPGTVQPGAGGLKSVEIYAEERTDVPVVFEQ